MKQPVTSTTCLTDEKLELIVRRLVKALSPRRIYLFGSHAYGTPGPDSDVDLMVVVRGEVPPVSVCYRKGHASLRGLFVPVELHFASEEGFERRRQAKGSLEHEIAERGRLTYASE
jgi:predicted nucleotidyltransferase